MSPRTLRRYRAERLLERDFAALQGHVLAVVAGRLRGCGVSLDTSDLEACYATAWQGLYMALLEGREIANPTGWLVLATFRRALDERRARERAGTDARAGTHDRAAAVDDRDLAAELDDRQRLRRLFEGLRARLGEREREAAVLCYLQGLPRAEAAARMGLSEARMRKLMEGRGPGRPGVAGKVGELVRSVRDGDWCEEQASLMRALAFGVLDPDGERHGLALAHRRDCPACRAYVASLRGLAAALPPALLPADIGRGLLARVGPLGHANGTGAQLAGGVGGAVPAGGVAGAGGAAGGAFGGGWLLAGGPLGAKLAVGCLLAVGVGAGCAALGGGLLAHAPSHRETARRAGAHARLADVAALPMRVSAPVGAGRQLASGRHAAVGAGGLAAPPTSPVRATREFGLEQAPASAASPARSSVTAPVRASGPAPARAHLASPSTPSSAATRAPAPWGSPPATSAVREFSPG